MILVIIPAVTLLFFFGDLILLLFGREYVENTFHVLRLLSISVISCAVNDLYVAVRRVQFQSRSITYIYSSVAILTLLSSYMLMPKLGLIGIGIGWLFGQSSVALFLITMVIIRTRRHS